MAWLRVDDGLAEHRKILQLKRGDRWTWMELLCHVARQNNGGHVHPGVTSTMRHVTPRFLQACEEIGLLDRDEDGTLMVHDWAIYNGGNIEARVRAYLEAHPGASANEVAAGVGGTRKIVLAEVAKQMGGGT